VRRPERRALLWLFPCWNAALLLAVPSAAAAHTGPLAAYRWVNPPSEVAAANTPPLSRQADLPAQRDRLLATDVWTGDLQATLALSETMLPARDRVAVSIAITPLDAAGLGAVPAPLSADGNAYDIALRDGDEDVGPLATPGRVILDVPHQATAVLFSPDGTRWTRLTPTATSASQVEATFGGPGFYLAATDHSLLGAPNGSSGMSGPLLAALVVLPVLACAGLVLLGRRSIGQRTGSDATPNRA
jgi:hypothetical protein